MGRGLVLLIAVAGFALAVASPASAQVSTTTIRTCNGGSCTTTEVAPVAAPILLGTTPCVVEGPTVPIGDVAELGACTDQHSGGGNSTVRILKLSASELESELNQHWGESIVGPYGEVELRLNETKVTLRMGCFSPDPDQDRGLCIDPL